MYSIALRKYQVLDINCEAVQRLSVPIYPLHVVVKGTIHMQLVAR